MNFSKIFLLILVFLAFFVPGGVMLFDDLKEGSFFWPSRAIHCLRFFWATECGHACYKVKSALRVVHGEIFVNKDFMHCLSELEPFP